MHRGDRTVPGELTHIAAAEYDHIVYGQMTPAMAAAYLREERIVLRSFGETLRRMYPKEDILIRLTEFWQRVDRVTQPQSLTKKIRNWLAGKNQPSAREDYFRIAFALGLSEQQLAHLLGLCTDYGIHYRSRWEVVFAWFLRSGYGYWEAEAFYAELPPAPTNETGVGLPPHVTHEMMDRFRMAQNTEALRACCVENAASFGSMHIRSYYYFDRYMAQLIHPTPSWDGISEPDYSIESVMNIYLSMQMPSGKKRTNYSLPQRLIKHNWPNTTTLKNIRSRVEDVPRKLLLLLYVVTENGGDDDYSEMDEEYLTLEERVEDHWWIINGMLADCGMAPLDPRNAFDWLVLYATASESEFMSDRLEQVIGLMYADVKE